MNKKVRVRFAPSPTGGLHLGGVRTALFNYLFARQHGGKFVLRIEDTDQTRFVEGAEDYILACLSWCGLIPDEGPQNGGPFGPYRQSERKATYRQYAEQLVKQGNAYYAFDTPEELDSKRKEIENFQYSHSNRDTLRNSTSLTDEEVKHLLASDIPYVIRLKVPEEEKVGFNDMIRGRVVFETNQVDDKVLLKADGMPTYHLAVVVDDYQMQITHAFRGEEWLPSAPVHILLWEYLGWKEAMPEWAHLPLILKPDGHGKLSKRDGDRLGFPVYAMSWKDPKSGDLTKGFKELGFLPEAFINMLTLLGWNDGTDQEIFTMDELIQKFSLDRVNKAGAKFDFEKAKWFNAEWIKRLEPNRLTETVLNVLKAKGIEEVDQSYLEKVIAVVKDRCVLLSDFWEQASFFFQQPEQYDLQSVKSKWTLEKASFYQNFIINLSSVTYADASQMEAAFKELAAEKSLKVGELMLPFRIMLVGGKFGPNVFEIAMLLGQPESVSRIEKALIEFNA